MTLLNHWFWDLWLSFFCRISSVKTCKTQSLRFPHKLLKLIMLWHNFMTRTDGTSSKHLIYSQHIPISQSSWTCAPKEKRMSSACNCLIWSVCKMSESCLKQCSREKGLSLLARREVDLQIRKWPTWSPLRHVQSPQNNRYNCKSWLDIDSLHLVIRFRLQDYHLPSRTSNRRDRKQCKV